MASYSPVRHGTALWLWWYFSHREGCGCRSYIYPCSRAQMRGRQLLCRFDLLRTIKVSLYHLSTLNITHVIKYPRLSPRFFGGLRVQRSCAGIIVRVDVRKGREPENEASPQVNRVKVGMTIMCQSSVPPIAIQCWNLDSSSLISSSAVK